ncbi:hypothetical protein Avbf_09336 [Armadillidium vulgare]|nr:hypothetical protein Avbf_09336 [Armadillidium vulgare]
MMIDVGVDTEDSSAVAISSAAMSKLKICKKIMQFYAYIIPKLFPTEDSNTYFISRQTDGIQQKRTMESSLKGTGISEKSFENLDYIQNKILKAKLKKY